MEIEPRDGGVHMLLGRVRNEGKVGHVARKNGGCISP